MDLYIKLSVCVPRLIPGRGFYAQISSEITSEFPGVTMTMIAAHPDEWSLTSSLAELARAMEVIPSRHAARIGEVTSNGIFTGVYHVLAFMRLAHPDLDLKEALDRGAADNARKDTMKEVGDLGESVLPLFEE